MSGKHSRDSLMREYYEFKATEQARRRARIRHAAALNRDLSLELLAERFDCTTHEIKHAIVGITREAE